MQLLQLVKRLRKRTIYQLSNVFVYINKMITPTFFFSLNAFISLFTLCLCFSIPSIIPRGILRSGQDVGGRPGHYFHLLSCTDH